MGCVISLDDLSDWIIIILTKKRGATATVISETTGADRKRVFQCLRLLMRDNFISIHSYDGKEAIYGAYNGQKVTRATTKKAARAAEKKSLEARARAAAPTVSAKRATATPRVKASAPQTPAAETKKCHIKAVRNGIAIVLPRAMPFNTPTLGMFGV
jgi:hypothetical protein